MKLEIGNGSIELMTGDITTLDLDAIVNAANEHLVLGGGVAGAIRRAGGPSIQEECNHIGGTFVGGAAITGAGDMPAKHVIHAVGPRWGEGDEQNKLRNAVANSLLLAEKNSLESIAIPAISTGIFGFPIQPAARIMLHTAADHLKRRKLPSRIIFCLFSQSDYDVFQLEAQELS